MPNWTTNRIIVRGLAEDVDAFLLQGKTLHSEFSYNGFIPQPGDLYHGPVGRDSPSHNWYNWNCENWGTKWDASDAFVDRYVDPPLKQLASSMSEERVSAKIDFRSPWSHPMPVFSAMVEKFPDLEFEITWRHEDCGSGRMTQHEEWHFEDDSEEDREIALSFGEEDPWLRCYECGEQCDLEDPAPGEKYCGDCS